MLPENQHVVQRAFSAPGGLADITNHNAQRNTRSDGEYGRGQIAWSAVGVKCTRGPLMRAPISNVEFKKLLCSVSLFLHKSPHLEFKNFFFLKVKTRHVSTRI